MALFSTLGYFLELSVSLYFLCIMALFLINVCEFMPMTEHEAEDKVYIKTPRKQRRSDESQTQEKKVQIVTTKDPGPGVTRKSQSPVPARSESEDKRQQPEDLKEEKNDDGETLSPDSAQADTETAVEAAMAAVEAAAAATMKMVAEDIAEVAEAAFDVVDNAIRGDAEAANPPATDTTDGSEAPAELNDEEDS